jgi:hypothetical protein
LPRRSHERRSQFIESSNQIDCVSGITR